MDHQSRSTLPAKKRRRDWLRYQAKQRQDWILVEEDECWFSRFAQPSAHTWAPREQSLHLVQRDPRRGEKDQALACFGAVRQETQQVYLHFSEGQPDSEQMWVFIMGLLDIARQEDKEVVVMLWDNASWHKSQRIRQWIRTYNRAAKRVGEPRLLTHLLPVKSPWLNPIEPHWIHAKRATCQPDGELSACELRQRLCEYFETDPILNSFKLSDLNLH